MKTSIGSVLAVAIFSISALGGPLNNQAIVVEQNLRAQLQNAQATDTQIQQKITTDKNEVTNLKSTQAENAKYIKGLPALQKQTQADVDAYKSTYPGMVDQLKALTDADATRASTVATAQQTLNEAQKKRIALHDAAFAAFVAVDPGKTAYAPVQAAHLALDAALLACQINLGKTPEFQEAAASLKQAEAELAAQRNAAAPSHTSARASQQDMDASNAIERMRSDAADKDIAVQNASQALGVAIVTFNPVLNKFEADLATQPGYAAALKEVTDDQNALTIAQAAVKQATEDETRLTTKSNALRSKGVNGAAQLKSMDEESARRTAQDTQIDKQVSQLDADVKTMEADLTQARANVTLLTQQHQNAVNQVKATRGR